MILEGRIETRLRERLIEYGFKVLKLYTPGHTGVMDRMILRPRYSPGPPMFLELKRPGKSLRRLQKAMEKDWTERGCIVLPMCDSLEKVDKLCDKLIQDILPDYAFARESDFLWSPID